MPKDAPDLIDMRLLKALEHPTRVHILSILSEGPSSPSRIARRMRHVGVNVRLVSYHMKILQRLGCVEEVESVEKGPGIEHIYEAKERQFFSAEEWERFDPKNRAPVTATLLRLISEEVSSALATGKFDELPDNHLSRSPVEVDKLGWAELVAILARAMHEVLAVHDKSVERAAASGEALQAARVVMMNFLIDREEAGQGKEGKGPPPSRK